MSKEGTDYQRSQLSNRERQMSNNPEYVRGAQPAGTLREAVIVDEVRRALKAWRSATDTLGAVLIGGLALAFYSRPRFVDEIEFLYAQEAAVPITVTGFRRLNDCSFAHEDTGVVLMVSTAMSSVRCSAISAKVHETAVERDRLRLASLEGMIALALDFAVKRKKRGATSPEQDIIDMIGWAPEFRLVDMESWPLEAGHHKLLEELYAIARRNEKTG